MKRYSAVNGSALVAAALQPRKAQESDDEYISRLQSDKTRIKRDIFVWTKDFTAKNSRQPSKQERELLAGPMFKAYRNVSTQRAHPSCNEMLCAAASVIHFVDVCAVCVLYVCILVAECEALERCGGQRVDENRLYVLYRHGSIVKSRHIGPLVSNSFLFFYLFHISSVCIYLRSHYIPWNGEFVFRACRHRNVITVIVTLVGYVQEESED